MLSAFQAPSAEAHGIYITVMEVDHDQKHQNGTVVIKSFSDDLTNALRSMNFNIPADANPCDEMDSVEDYLENHFELRINESAVDWTIEDCAIENETHWIYLSYQIDTTMTSKVEIKTDWMTELFGNQQNIIKVKLDDTKVNGRLSKDQTRVSFDF